MSRDILIAVVLGAHGLKGEMRVKTFTETPRALERYKQLRSQDGRSFHLAQLRAVTKDEAIICLGEVGDRTAAEVLKGLELFVARETLPAPDENEFYYADLIGLGAEDQAGRQIGTVKAIHNYGAGDVIEIARGAGDTVMLPFSREFVPAVDLKAARIVIAVPEDVETGERGNVE